jgi:hypothetical protein
MRLRRQPLPIASDTSRLMLIELHDIFIADAITAFAIIATPAAIGR